MIAIEERVRSLDNSYAEMHAELVRAKEDIKAAELRLSFKENRTEAHDVEIERLKQDFNNFGNITREQNTRIAVIERRMDKFSGNGNGKLYLRDIVVFARLWEIIKDFRTIIAIVSSGTMIAWLWNSIKHAIKELK